MKKRILFTVAIMLLSVTTLIAQFNKVSAQTKHYTFTFSTVKVSSSMGVEAKQIKGKGTVDICDKKGAAPTITVTYGKTKKVFKIAKEAYNDGPEEAPCLIFDEVDGNNHILFQYSLSLTHFEGEENICFTRAENTGDGLEYWPLLEFWTTKQESSKNIKTFKQFFNDMKSGKTYSLKME